MHQKTSELPIILGGIKWEHRLLPVVNIPFKINSFAVNFPFFIPPEKTRKPEVFRGYQVRTLVRNGLRNCFQWEPNLMVDEIDNKYYDIQLRTGQHII